MFPGINPKQMQAAMKQLGISQEEIDAIRVIIEKSDNKKIVIENPSVQKIKMQGQESFQISGEVSEEENISDDDVAQVVEKTGCTSEQARETLEKFNGDLAEAILELS